MEIPRARDDPGGSRQALRSNGGIVSMIRLANFMCDSSLRIELGDQVNFITGQNGSGKSAILTALCVAFGCRAKGTQRNLSKPVAVVQVDLKNKGEDGFKPEVYSGLITIERRITESSSTTTLKDIRGKKIASGKDGKEKLRELLEHFNVMARMRSGRIYEKDRQEVARQWLADWRLRNVGHGTEEEPFLFDVEEEPYVMGSEEDPEEDSEEDLEEDLEEDPEEDPVQQSLESEEEHLFTGFLVDQEVRTVLEHLVYVHAKDDTALFDKLYFRFKSLEYRWPHMTEWEID